MSTKDKKRNRGLALKNFLWYCVDCVIACAAFIFGFGVTPKNWFVIFGLYVVSRVVWNAMHNAWLRKRVQSDFAEFDPTTAMMREIIAMDIERNGPIAQAIANNILYGGCIRRAMRESFVAHSIPKQASEKPGNGPKKAREPAYDGRFPPGHPGYIPGVDD